MASRDADRRTYKTVAMPSAIRGGRRRGKTKADRVAFAMAEIINAEAEAGWTYLGADTLRVEEKAGLFGGVREAVYTVLVFEREGVAAAPRRAEPTYEADPVEDVRRRPAAPAARREPEPVSEPMRAAADAVRRQAAEAAGQRDRGRARGYGFDDDLTADRGDGRQQTRRRETRPASRRSSDGDFQDDGWDDRAPVEPSASRRGLVETMRNHRGRT